MSDPKPYTVAEVLAWPALGPMASHNFRVLATVRALEAATQRAEAAEAAMKAVDDWRGDVQARIDNGKGTWPKPGYVTDEVWSNWHERRATLDRVADIFARVLGGGR